MSKDYPSPELYYDAVREIVWHANLTEPELGLSFERLDLICYDAEHECFTVLFKDGHEVTDIWWIDKWRVENGYSRSGFVLQGGEASC